MKLYDIFGIGGNSLGFGGGGGTSLPSITDSGALVTSSSILNLTAAASTTNAAIRFNSVATTGVMFGASTLVGLQVDASNWMLTSSTQGNCLIVPPAGVIGWSSSSTFASAVADTMFGRRAAASIRLGAADINGSPVAQTLSVQNAITGSNLAGADFTIAGSTGTGNALPAKIVLTSANIAASGTTAQTGLKRFVALHAKSLTNNSATALIRSSQTANTWSSVQIYYAVEITDGTDYQVETGIATFASIAKGAAITHATPAKVGNTQVVSAGTLAVTFTAVTNGSASDYTITSNSSLTTTTNRVLVEIMNLSSVNDITLL